MNLIDGKIFGTKDCDPILDTLEERITRTLAGEPLPIDALIAACDRLSNRLELGAYLPALQLLGIDPLTAERYLAQAKAMLSRDYLRSRLEIELGQQYDTPRSFTPLGNTSPVTQQIKPLGVLLHIAAGNADALPAFSVLEGLLVGNINLLKLPAEEGGISVYILKELIGEEPLLAPYIYVFDYSSKDLTSMEKLISAADAVVVWGGDAAVTALRRLVKPHTKLIEWGHKISFAYLSQGGMEEEALHTLAGHICENNQLFCSSCQGIYLDTEDMEEVYAFCARFLPILEKSTTARPLQLSLAQQAQLTLQLYSRRLSPQEGSRIFTGEGVSIAACPDATLEPAMQFRNLWVKPLPRQKLLATLRPHKNHLQTAALLCAKDEFPSLAETLGRTGIVRITDPSNMSTSYCGAAHDGEYPLRRYTKILSYEGVN